MRVTLFHNEDAGEGTSVHDLTETIERHGHRVVDVVGTSDDAARVLDAESDLVVASGGPGQRVVLMNPRRAQAEAEKRAEQEQRQRFKSFVGSLAHRGTDLRAWEKVIGRECYNQYRDALFAEGYARWTNGKNDRNGWKLAAPVDEILKSIVE